VQDQAGEAQVIITLFDFIHVLQRMGRLSSRRLPERGIEDRHDLADLPGW